jgi:type I restriction enzyme S subunit
MAVNPKDFLSYKTKLPSLLEQQKIAEVLSLADDEINLLKNELEELKLQKKGLMQKLLTGEVRVMI